MSEQASNLAEDEVIATLSDYLDGALADDERKLVAERIERDAEWKRVHSELVETRDALSGLQKARAPATFATDVASTIHQRSAGRFFARRTLGDRVPFGVLLIVAMLAMAVIAYVLWSSPTGSLRAPHEAAGSGGGSGTELVPKP
jgi:anti-sigma factor RsiW